MANHYILRMVDSWKQEIGEVEARQMQRRQGGFSGVGVRHLRNSRGVKDEGGLVGIQHIVGLMIVDEAQWERMKREDRDFVALSPVEDEPAPVDATRAFVDELSETPLPLVSNPLEVPEELRAEEIVAGMSNDEFRNIYEDSGLSQQKFADKLTLGLTTIRMSLKNDRPVSQETEARVREVFKSEE